MTQIFNTNFEISRRLLLLLSIHKRELDIDVITALDLITTYSKNYDLGSENLHGDNSLSFSEITIRRELISKAIKNNKRFVCGLDMLIYQAQRAVEIWYGKKPSFENMKIAALEQFLLYD